MMSKGIRAYGYEKPWNEQKIIQMASRRRGFSVSCRHRDRAIKSLALGLVKQGKLIVKNGDGYGEHIFYVAKPRPQPAPAINFMEG